MATKPRTYTVKNRIPTPSIIDRGRATPKNPMVRFKLDIKFLLRSGKNHKTPEDAIVRVMLADLFGFRGSDRSLFDRHDGAIIVCTPEQFVRFLVWRFTNGFPNAMQNLDITIIEQGEDDGEKLPTLHARADFVPVK